MAINEQNYHDEKGTDSAENQPDQPAGQSAETQPVQPAALAGEPAAPTPAVPADQPAATHDQPSDPASDRAADRPDKPVPNLEEGHTATTIGAGGPQRYVIMPLGGLPGLAAELWSKDVDDQAKMQQHIDDLYEVNRDMLPNTLAFQAGQMVRIPDGV